MTNEKNLIPIRTKSEAREKGRNGGIKSGESRRAKKLFSQAYAEYLAGQHNIIISGQNKKTSGQQLLNSVISKILARGDMTSVMMIKEMREATEPPPAPKFDINKFLSKA